MLCFGFVFVLFSVLWNDSFPKALLRTRNVIFVVVLTFITERE